MKNKFALIVGLAIVFLACGGTALALHTFSESIAVPSMTVGQQGIGGVTYFNGTIVNTTTESGVGNPVTFGDDVRIDGEIFRTEMGGVNPLKIADSIRPTTDGEYDLGEAAFNFNDLYLSGDLIGENLITSNHITDGTIATADIANNAIGSANIIDGSIARIDIADDAIDGTKISNIANLDIDTLITSGDINGVDVTSEISVYYDTDDNTNLTAPADNPTTSKMVIGSTKMPACDKDSPTPYTYQTITLPFSFTNDTSYVVTLGAFGFLVPYYETVAVYKDSTNFDTFYVMVKCEDFDINADYTVDWMAVGY